MPLMPDFTPTPDQMAQALGPQMQQGQMGAMQMNPAMLGQNPMGGAMGQRAMGMQNPMANQMNQPMPGAGMLGTPPPPAFRPPSAQMPPPMPPQMPGQMGRINPALQRSMPMGMNSGQMAPNISGQMPAQLPPMGQSF